MNTSIHDYRSFSLIPTLQIRFPRPLPLAPRLCLRPRPPALSQCGRLQEEDDRQPVQDVGKVTGGHGEDGGGVKVLRGGAGKTVIVALKDSVNAPLKKGEEKLPLLL